MTDDMLRAVTKNGGVVMINYHVGFLSEEYPRGEREASRGAVPIAAKSKKCGSDEACSTLEATRDQHEAMMKGDAAEGRRGRRSSSTSTTS